MLPSSGLFKDIVCPYYKNAAGCQRPYCHFRHAKNGDIIEQLNDTLIKEALRAKQYHNVLQSSNSEDFHSTIPREPEKIQDCQYRPTPLSQLKSDQQVFSNQQCVKSKSYCPTIPAKYEAPIYIPSSITHDKKSKSDTKEEGVVSLVSSHYIPSLCNGSKREEDIVYTPSSSKFLHKNENAYEPFVSTSTNDDKKANQEVINYKPSSSSSVNQNVNTYEPNAASLPETNNKNEELAYKPSANTEFYQHSNVYEPHGSSSKMVDYQPSKTSSNKRTSPNILNEISNLSGEIQSPAKKPKINIDLNHFQNEFNIIDEILCASNDIQLPTKNRKNSDISSSNKKHSSSRKSNDIERKHTSIDKHKSSSPKKTSSSNHSSKHKSSSHHSSSSSRKSKHKSRSSVKDNKEHPKTKHKSCDKDKEHSHQSKTKETKEKTSSKNTISSEKSKNKRKHDSSNSHSKKPHKRKNTSENTEQQPETSILNALTEDDYLFSDDDRELDRPVCSTDLKDPIVLECLRISEEYNNSIELFKSPVEKPMTKTTINDITEVPNNVVRKRIAHSAASSISRAPNKQVKKFTPATIFVERYKKVMEAQRMEELEECEKRLEAMINSDTPLPPSQNNLSISQMKSNLANNMNIRPTLSKPVPTRIAHVPKNTPPATMAVQTLKKGMVRKAHVPDQSVLKKMDSSNLLDLNNCRIPSNVRLSYLNFITEACLVLHNNDVDRALEMARQEELLVAKKCMNIKVYKNSCLASILKIRKSTKEQTSTDQTVKKGAEGITYENMTASQKYKHLKRWILSERELEQNSFPLPTGVKGMAKILHESKVFVCDSNSLRQCSRCPKQYSVDDAGIPLTREACVFHPKRCYTFRGRSTYGCCGSELGTVGCCSGDHVIEGILGAQENMRTGFVQTMSKPYGHPANENIYAIDCEMVYTTKGIELARVTVVNDNLETVYDTFVKPAHYILDYATVFSGITEEMLRDVSTTIFHVQAVLLNMFSDKTILVGHSLESDLKALKLIHKSIVDTSVLFPHKAGPPYKRALKTLANEFLRKIIQESHLGHDSAEDARISLELVLYKLRDSLRC